MALVDIESGNGNNQSCTNAGGSIRGMDTGSLCCSHYARKHTNIGCDESNTERLVIIRYFLDRQGYDANNSSARLWKDPPANCHAEQIRAFLSEEGIVMSKKEGIIAEVYLDKFQSYMTLDACSDSIEFDFSTSSPENPKVLIVRLTDAQSHECEVAIADSAAASVARSRQMGACSMSPAGLFAFSMVVGMDAAFKTGELVAGFVQPRFMLTFSVYAFFVGGLLQVLVGMWEVTRNNIYGATAFSAFGCFWLASGLQLILTTYFPGQISEELLGADPWGNFVTTIYKFGLIAVLFKQTFTMNKLSTVLISVLALDLLFGAFSGFSLVLRWIDVATAWLVTGIAFWLFFAELTNEVYQCDVFPLYPWRKDATHEIMGAAGRSHTLYATAAQLRCAQRQSTGETKTATSET